MSAPIPDIPVAVLWRETAQRADALPGFDRARGHRLPDAVTPRATAFVRRLATALVEEELEACHGALRARLGYKRRQLRVTIDADAAAIATPDFELHFVVLQDPEDPARVLLRRMIQGVQTPSVLGSAGFAEVFGGLFGGGFDGLDLSAWQRIDVAGLIDALEDREPPGWALDYGYEASALTLTHPQVALTVHVTSDRIRLVGDQPQGAPVLLKAAEAALTAMGGHDALGALALDH